MGGVDRIFWSNPSLGSLSREKVAQWLLKCAENYGYRLGKVHYSFFMNDEIQKRNNALLAHDYPTDIITLDYSKGTKLIYECLIGYEVIIQNAQHYDVSYEDELRRVLVHGMLHCMGFDDQSEEEKQIMRREEEFCLNLPLN